MGNYAYVDATIDFKTTDEKVYEETRALFSEHFPDENGDDDGCDYEITGKTIRVICSACSGYDEDDDDNTIDFIDALEEIAPIADGSDIEFRSEDYEFWRYVFEKGKWRRQEGEIVFHD